MRVRRRLFAVLCLALLSLTAGAARAQSGGKAAAPKAAPDVQDSQKAIDEIAETTRILPGAAGNPECYWLGRRVVVLLWRDDIDTAKRHIDFYDRFRCPGEHIQAAFRCLVRQGNIDPKAQETLNGRVRACWLDPGMTPPPPAAAKEKEPATSGGTARR